MTRLTDDEIKAARELEQAATPGPWETADRHRTVGIFVWRRGEDQPGGTPGSGYVRVARNVASAPDAAFIAAARTLVPRLLAEVTERRAADLKPEEVESLEVLLRWFDDDLDVCDSEHVAEAGADVVRRLLAAHGARQ